MSHPQAQRMLEEWRRSRRLRLGALAVLAILGGHATLTMSDRLHAREEAFDRDAQLLGRLEEASRESGWPARARAAEAALAEARHSIPPARSDGLAQAEMQAWLSDLAVYAGLAGPTVRVETSLPVPGQPGTWQVLARLDAQSAPSAIPVLARALTSAMPWVRTERLEIVGGDPGRVSVVVRGYYRKGDALDAKTPPPRPAELPAAASAPAAAQPQRNPLARPAANPLAQPAANPLARPPANPRVRNPRGRSTEDSRAGRRRGNGTPSTANPVEEPSAAARTEAPRQWGGRTGKSE